MELLWYRNILHIHLPWDDRSTFYLQCLSSDRGIHANIRDKKVCNQKNSLSEVTTGTSKFYCLTWPFKSQWLLRVPLALMLKNSVFAHILHLSVSYDAQNKTQLLFWTAVFVISLYPVWHRGTLLTTN
jgi:hypothetical protein